MEGLIGSASGRFLDFRGLFLFGKFQRAITRGDNPSGFIEGNRSNGPRVASATARSAVVSTHASEEIALRVLVFPDLAAPTPYAFAANTMSGA
jgi:hypothetical protein